MAFIVLLVLFLGLSFFLISQQINSLIKKTKQQQKEIESLNTKLDELAKLFNQKYDLLFKNYQELTLTYQETLDKCSDCKENITQHTKEIFEITECMHDLSHFVSELRNKNDKSQLDNNDKSQPNSDDKSQPNSDDKSQPKRAATSIYVRDLQFFNNKREPFEHKREPFSLKRIYPGRYD